MRVLALLLLLLGAAPARAAAQALRVEGMVDGPAAALLRAIAEQDDFRVLDRDTVLPATTRIPGDLVIVGADVRLAGQVEGRVAVLGGELFIRPGARVGDVVVAGGAVYPSALASVGEIHQLPLDVAVDVAAEDGGYAVALSPPPGPSAAHLEGLLGFGAPAYDRVNGVALRYGASLYPGDRAGARLRGAATYHSARGELGGEAALEVPFGRGLWAAAQAYRGPVTNEQWIRGNLANSLAALFVRSDARNYHQVDEISLSLTRRPEQPLIQGESFVGPRLVLRASEDRSLDARDPWSLFGDEWRPNPPVAEGTLVSLIAGAEAGWRGATSRFDGDLAVEWAPGAWGDFEFARLVAEGRWEMLALWGHSIGVYARTLLPVGGNGAPPQRWSFVGGSNTLPTLEFGALRGDHLVFIESVYAIPLARFQLPLIGAPDLQLVHATGTAWATGEQSPRWEQNLGVGLAFSLVEINAYVNPSAGSLAPELSAGLSLPF